GSDRSRGRARSPESANSHGPVRSGTTSQLRPNRPQVREERPSEGFAEVCGAAGASRSRSRTNRPLDHLHVPIPPLLNALIEIHEPLTQFGVLRVVPINGDQRGLWILKLIAFATHILQKRVPQCGFVVPAFERGARPSAFGKAVDRLC